jgi:hypothetical protein
VVSGQWSVVSGQWSVVSGQWSVVSGQWSAVTGEDKKEVASSLGRASVSLAVSRILRGTSSISVGRCGFAAPTL